jgi:hypothetical protein
MTPSAIAIGKHRLKVAEDVLFMKFIGNLDSNEAKELMRFLDDTYGSNPFFVILDYSEMGGVDSESRKRLIDWIPGHNPVGAAIFGANVTTRAIAILVQSAVRLLGKKVVPITFVHNLEHAHMWLDEQRRKKGARELG